MAERSPAIPELYYTIIILTSYKNQTMQKVRELGPGVSSSEDKGYGGTIRRPAHTISGLVKLIHGQTTKGGKRTKD